MSASLAAQRLMMTALGDIPGLSGIYDGPPPDAASPYLVIGADTVTDWSTKTETGHEHRIAVNVWEAGPGTAPVKAMMAEVETRLANLSGARDGHRLVSSRLLRTLVLTDPEGWSQGIVEFRLRTIAE